MTDFLAAIDAAPRAWRLRLYYADWLDQQSPETDADMQRVADEAHFQRWMAGHRRCAWRVSIGDDIKYAFDVGHPANEPQTWFDNRIDWRGDGGQFCNVPLIGSNITVPSRHKAELLLMKRVKEARWPWWTRGIVLPPNDVIYLDEPIYRGKEVVKS